MEKNVISVYFSLIKTTKLESKKKFNFFISSQTCSDIKSQNNVNSFLSKGVYTIDFMYKIRNVVRSIDRNHRTVAVAVTVLVIALCLG